MRLPPVDSSSNVYLGFASYVEGALEGFREAETITSEQSRVVTQVSQDLISLVEVLHRKATAAETARRATRRARARYSVRDVLLDMRVMATSDAVLNGPAARQRQHVVYQQIFQGVTPTKIAGSNIHDEPDVVARLRDRLVAAPTFAGKDRLVEGLDVALKQSYAARDALRGAEAVEARAMDEERAARMELRRGLEEAYGHLLAAFAGNRSLAESFFPKETAAKSAKQQPASPDEEGMEGEG